MALTKISIHEDVMRRIRPLSVTVERIDTELLSVVKDISTRGDFLTGSATIATVAATIEYTLTELAKSVLFMGVTGGVQLTRSDLANVDALNHGGSTGSPLVFAQLGRAVRLSPTPDAVYSIAYRYTKIHGDTITTLELTDVFRECIVQGVIAMLFSGQLVNIANSYDRFSFHRQLYEQQLQDMRGMNYQDAPIVQYQGL